MIQKTALDFAKSYMLPFAREWDKTSTSPIEVYKKAGELGFGSIYTSVEYGGSGMDRISASLVMEALATACVSTSAYVSIHNLNCWIIDTYASESLKK